MRAIYIRHAEKEFRNGEAEIFTHDPGITENGALEAKKVARKLINLWGFPKKIISSPYRRARETALIMNAELLNPLEIDFDNSLAEYLGNHRYTQMDVTMATKIHRPPHPESFDEMKKRVNKHLKHTKKLMHDNPNEVIWYITHGIILKQVAANYGVKTIDQLPSLTCLSVLEDDELSRVEFLIFTSSLKSRNLSTSQNLSNSKYAKFVKNDRNDRNDRSESYKSEKYEKTEKTEKSFFNL
jgi:broad specificity phosphatase PhoE